MKLFLPILRLNYCFLHYISPIVIGISLLIVGFPQEDMAQGALSNVADHVFKTVSMEGFVKNAQTLDSWPGATVFLFNQTEGKVYVAKTNNQGKYEFRVSVPCKGIIKAMDKNTFNDCMAFSIDTPQIDFVQEADRDLIIEKIAPDKNSEEFDPTLYKDGQQFDYAGTVMQRLDFAPCLVIAPDSATDNVPQTTGLTSQLEASFKPVILPFEGEVLQLGAFKKKNAGFVFRKIVAAKVKRNVTIVYENGFQKVQIPGFATRSQARAYMAQVEHLGFKAIYIPLIKKGMSVQVATQANEVDALNAQKIWSNRTSKPVVAEYEHQLFKVLVKRFKNQAEAELFVQRQINAAKVN